MKKAIKLIAVVGLLFVAGLALAIILGPPGPKLICHVELAAAFEQWKLETKSGDWYPNVEGNSIKSLAAIAPYYGSDMTRLRDYKYVPGLKSSDPKNLILMYVIKPSQRKWHGDTHWFRKEKRWIVINPQMQEGDDDRWSEAAEWIPADEFTNRLAATLRFLSENKRPNWTNTVKEQSEFLSSLQK